MTTGVTIASLEQKFKSSEEFEKIIEAEVDFEQLNEEIYL